MAKQSPTSTADAAQHGGDRVLLNDLPDAPADNRRVKIPNPVLEPEPAKAEKAKAENESAPAPVAADVHVPASHMLGELVRNGDGSRLYRLEAAARNDSDVKWLLGEYLKTLNSKKK